MCGDSERKEARQLWQEKEQPSAQTDCHMAYLQISRAIS